MVGLIVTGHGTLATGLLDSLSMVVGEQPCVQAVPFIESRAGTYAADLRDAIRTMHRVAEGVIVLADFVGGTPFTQAMLAAHELDAVEVVAGVNAPMLLKLVSERTDCADLSQLVECIVEAGKAGVVHTSLKDIMGSTDSSLNKDAC